MKSGRRVSGQLMNWFFLPDQREKRIGIVVSNRVSRQAIERNQIKRWLRGFCQESLGQLPIGRLVLLVKRAPKGREKLRAEALRLLRELKKGTEG